jgi:hypothetical protein
MTMLFRILVAVLGLLSILTALPHWFRVEGLAAARGIQALEAIGRANVRADIGGIFLAIGILALLAAWKQNETWLAATIIVVASALFGRFISFGLDGIGAHVMEPVVVEAVVLAILAGAWFSWKNAPEGL